mmetsp:Transcript_30223/g.85382  ORF Transcript_30223/g.85382 Transcript_30223/m.85382 type:complete len:268 (+) Transcript_30223:6605-7408(+)
MPLMRARVNATSRLSIFCWSTSAASSILARRASFVLESDAASACCFASCFPASRSASCSSSARLPAAAAWATAADWLASACSARPLSARSCSFSAAATALPSERAAAAAEAAASVAASRWASISERMARSAASSCSAICRASAARRSRMCSSASCSAASFRVAASRRQRSESSMRPSVSADTSRSCSSASLSLTSASQPCWASAWAASRRWRVALSSASREVSSPCVDRVRSWRSFTHEVRSSISPFMMAARSSHSPRSALAASSRP